MPPMPSVSMRSKTLLTQVLAVNAALVVVTALVASLAQTAATLAVGVLSVILLNSLLLRHRLRPLEHLAETMDTVVINEPARAADLRAQVDPHAAKEVVRLGVVLNAMLDRLQSERRGASRAVLRAQELERARIARDLHDEVNQSLTGLKLRLSALTLDAPDAMQEPLRELQMVADGAMGELLRLTRQLRPTALDDHGLIPALRSQVSDFQARTGIRADFRRSGALPDLTDEEQLVAFRITQESLTNVAQHAGARSVSVELRGGDATVLRVTDDGAGFEGAGRADALGLSGMRERALLVGGDLSISSRPGAGTTVQLTMGAA